MITQNWEMTQQDLELIDLAFIEDLGLQYQDITTSILFADNKGNNVKSNIVSKHPTTITICGLFLVKIILAKFSNVCEFSSEFHDGQKLTSGEVLLSLSGPAPVLLKIERILLNFLQRLCAVATLTAQFVDLIKHTKTKILDTRKTTPGLRHLEKYAVSCGGGVNHRMGLYDTIMIKDTHIDFLGGISKTLSLLPNNITQTFPVIIEVRNLEELHVVLEKACHKVSRVLLDNMSISLLTKSVESCKNLIATEASGNINLNNIVEVAETGVDFISLGRLTHSAGNIDLSMQCEI